MIYRVDLTHGKLNPNDEPWARVNAGAGPRHFAFHPNGRYAYVINELNSALAAFAYDEKRGTLTKIEAVSTLPEDFRGENNCAEVHVSPSGKFLYGSNRGHDSIVIFAIDESTGRLTYVGHEPTQGKTPRNFAIDPTGTCAVALGVKLTVPGPLTLLHWYVPPLLGGTAFLFWRAPAELYERLQSRLPRRLIFVSEGFDKIVNGFLGTRRRHRGSRVFPDIVILVFQKLCERLDGRRPADLPKCRCYLAP